MRLDEILAAMPDVGLALNCLQEKVNSGDWYACIRETGGEPPATLFDGWGDSALDAMVMAVRRAGIDVTDD